MPNYDQNTPLPTKNKEKIQAAAVKKAKRKANDAQAAALRDAMNAPQADEPSPEEKIARLTESESEIIPIPRPKGQFNIQIAMGLADNRKESTQIQAGIHAIAVEAKIDFESTWSQQSLDTVRKVLHVAARYMNSVRAYESGKENPSSGVSRRRQRVTKMERLEGEARRHPSRRDDRAFGDEDDGEEAGEEEEEEDELPVLSD
ncbi:hypothetical protein DFH06DRAFT_1484486 [Mycena polygramma]|nr:hypothetical protein DFH06DRAFT_1484486 [Mycena polygramma]